MSVLAFRAAELADIALELVAEDGHAEPHSGGLAALRHGTELAQLIEAPHDSTT